jgi:hypothetical protein
MADDLKAQAPAGLRAARRHPSSTCGISNSPPLRTEIMGFRCVAQLKSIPGRTRPKMRFYSGVSAQGDVGHHDYQARSQRCRARREPGRWDPCPVTWA